MTQQPTETAFAQATRIAAGDDGTNYDNVTVTLHWLTALLVFVQFGLAETWDDFPRATQESMQSLHVSLGVLLTLVVLARLTWRFIPGHQLASLETGWIAIASKSVHYLLYGLVAAQVLTGFLFRWSQGHPVSFFGLFAVPSPLGAPGSAARHQLHGLHDKIGWAIIILALAHAAAALYHHYVLRDRVLRRMLPGDGAR